MGCAVGMVLRGFSVFDHLHGEGVPLRAAATFGDRISAALWGRHDRADTCYQAPGHHTLSLYLAGGEAIRRRRAGAWIGGGGAGRFCLMPAGLSTEWEVASAVLMLHLYIPTAAFGRAVAEMLGADPAAVGLQDRTFFVDPGLEALVRRVLLPLDWNAPSDRLAAAQAAQAILARLVAGYTDRGPRALVARGGLSPRALRQAIDRIEAGLDGPIGLDELAGAAGLSTFHFARMFKHSTGQTPQGFVLRRRIERARQLLADDRLGLAEIALACGFSGQSHFTARFRAVTGLTPGQYRRA